MQKYDVIIAGSGISGLMSALYLADKGYKCLIIEKQPFFGGKIRGFYNKGTYYPYGVSFIGSMNENEFLNNVFKKYGILDKVEFGSFPNNELYTLLINDEAISIPSDKEALFSMLNSSFPEEKDKIAQIKQELEKYDVDFGKFQENLFELFLDTENTVWEKIKDIENITLKKIFLSFSFLYGAFPIDTPMYVYTYILNSYLKGAKYIKGGGIKLVEGLVERLSELNVDMHKNEELIKVNLENKLVKTILTDKGEYETDKLIYTGEPYQIPDIIGRTEVKKRYAKKIDNLKPGITIFCSYFELKDDSLLDKENHCRHFFCMDGDYDIFLSKKNLDKSNYDEKLNFLSIFINNDNGRVQIYGLLGDNYHNYDKYKDKDKKADYNEFKKKLENLIKGRIEEIFPALKGNLIPTLSYTPLTIERFYGSKEGNLFGVYAEKEQKGLNTLLPMTPIKNLIYLGENTFLIGVQGCTASSLLILENVAPDAKL